jgi:hypothetical protein
MCHALGLALDDLLIEASYPFAHLLWSAGTGLGHQ